MIQSTAGRSCHERARRQGRDRHRCGAGHRRGAILHLGTLEHTPPEVFRRLLEVNTVGPFLVSDASRYCAGVDLPADGGASAGRFIPGFNTL